MPGNNISSLRKNIVSFFGVVLFLVAGAYGAPADDTHISFIQVSDTHWGFIALDNVSSGDGSLGTAQLQWLEGVLKGFSPDSQLVVFSR